MMGSRTIHLSDSMVLKPLTVDPHGSEAVNSAVSMALKPLTVQSLWLSSR
jgi:hypothetical protein